MYADAPEKLKSLVDVVQAMPEGNFYTQKSNLSIFRYEDVIFAIFPHLAALKRRGASTKEIFSKNDPFSKKDGAEPFPGAQFAENSERGLGAESGTASRTLNASRAAGLQSHGNQTGYGLPDPTNTSQRLGAGQSRKYLHFKNEFIRFILFRNGSFQLHHELRWPPQRQRHSPTWRAPSSEIIRHSNHQASEPRTLQGNGKEAPPNERPNLLIIKEHQRKAHLP